MEKEKKLKEKINELKMQIAKRDKQIVKYKRLVQVIQQAETIEQDIYDMKLDDSWIALSKDDYEKIMLALAHLDELEPWKITMEKRLER